MSKLYPRLQQLLKYRNNIIRSPLSAVRCYPTDGSSGSSGKFPGGKEVPAGKGSPISWKTVGVTAGIGGLLTAYMLYLRGEKEMMRDRERRRQLGKAAIGGNFDLVDTAGKPCSSKDFLGNWLLIYFGFTHCPDVCPDEIEKMVNVIDELDKLEDVPKVTPVFITVDPERDSGDVVAKYCAEFSPKIVGLTGSPDQVQRACKAYRVYSSIGPRDFEDDYIVDHTIITYLIDPEGEFVDYYGQTRSVEEMVASIRYNMLKYDNRHKKSWISSTFS